MTTTTTIDLAHPVQVVTDPRPVDGLGHRAECACGWAGPWQTDQADAEVDALDHPEVAVGPGDGLDRVMSGLLDLQDDLAAVVMWLAENWSAHLPELGWYSNGRDDDTDHPAVTVMGYCTRDELADAAAVLGVAPVDDPARPTSATLYRSAVRRFGRVAIRVYTTRDPETAP